MSADGWPPEGWDTTTIGEVCSKPQYGWTTKANSEQGHVRLLRTSDISKGEVTWDTVPFCSEVPSPLDNYLLKECDIVVSRAGSVGLSHLLRSVPVEAVFASYLIRFRVRQAIVPEYLAYFLQSPRYWRVISEEAAGIAMANVNARKLEAIRIPLAPLAEQHRIVAAIEEQLSRLDAGVAALERVRANLKRYRAAVLKAAVEGKLTETWREDNPDLEPASELLKRILRERRERWEQGQLEAYEAKGKKPPKNWQEKYRETVEPETEKPLLMAEKWLQTSIGRCFEVRVGATPSRARADFWDGTVPWVSSGEIQFCRINETKQHISEAGLRNSSTKLNPAGSVLLGMIGEGRTRGQVAIQDIEAANNQNCAAILVSETEVVPEYIYYWLWSRYEMTRNAGSGNNQPALNKTRVQNLPLALPPIAEQKVLVAEVDRRMSVLREVEAEVDVNLKRASRLRQSILKCAFEGKLVPHDTSDEPASKLLERIREERDQAAPKKKGRMKKPARVAEDPQGSLFTSVESRG